MSYQLFSINLQDGHDVRYRTQCTEPDFMCMVRYGIELVCKVFWCVRYFSGSEKVFKKQDYLNLNR